MLEIAKRSRAESVVGLGINTDLPGLFSRSALSNAPVDARIALAKVATSRVYRPNEFLYLQHDEADYLYIVRSGHVRLSCLMEDGANVLFGFLSAGEIFGELGVLEGGEHCDAATTVGAASIVSIAAGAFRQLAAQHPALDVALGRIVARRYRSYIDITRSLRLKTLEALLAHAVLRLADNLGMTFAHADGRVPGIGPFVTQADFGLMARGARGNVNRHFKEWERAGIVALEGRCVLILDRSRLVQLTLEDGL